MKTLVNQVGPWVSGSRFWDREAEIEDLLRRLKEGANILLLAQRRTGKTSLMREVGQRLEEEYLCLHLDLQQCESVADMVVQLGVETRPHQKLWKKMAGIFRNTLSGAAKRIDELSIDEFKIKLRDGLSGDWKPKGDRMLSVLAASDKPVVLFIDELPILVVRLLREGTNEITSSGRKEADALMSWLRAKSIEHQECLRFVVTGSIGLEPVLAQAGLSATINSFTPYELLPWDTETAVGCLQALSNQYQLTLGEGTAELMVQLLGCSVPHHVQMFFSHLLDDCTRRHEFSPTDEDVQRVYESRMLSNRGHAELSHLEERLKQVISHKLLPLTLDLLTEAAVTGELSEETASILVRDHGVDHDRQQKTLRDILGILEHDGYLTKHGQGSYVFVSRLVKDWWRARFRFGYTPAAQRDQ